MGVKMTISEVSSKKYQQFPNQPERQKFWDEFTKLSKCGDLYFLNSEALRFLNNPVVDTERERKTSGKMIQSSLE
jgi:hypothetical protein